MTETQYLLGWVVYLLGGTGFLLGLWLLIRRWHPRIKRCILVLFAVLIYVPGVTRPDMDFMAPAFLIALFDGLTYGVEAMARAGQSLIIMAGAAGLVALLLPTGQRAGKQQKQTQENSATPDQPAANGQRQRKEPTC